MKLKVGKAQSKYLSKPIPVGELNNDWIIWLILGIVGLSGIIYLCIR